MRVNCQYRSDVRDRGEKTSTCQCALLNAITGAATGEEYRVRYDACRVCVNLPAEPTIEQPGKVVASLACAHAMETGGKEKWREMFARMREFLGPAERKRPCKKCRGKTCEVRRKEKAAENAKTSASEATAPVSPLL